MVAAAESVKLSEKKDKEYHSTSEGEWSSESNSSNDNPLLKTHAIRPGELKVLKSGIYICGDFVRQKKKKVICCKSFAVSLLTKMA